MRRPRVMGMTVVDVAGRPVIMVMPRVAVIPVVVAVVVMGMRAHGKCYIITFCDVHGPTEEICPQARPRTMAAAAARNGNGTETAARNQTNRAGIKGISQISTRWNENSAHATT